MTNPEHMAILKMGTVADWNVWRREHPEVRPDFRGAELYGADLQDANLIEANLSEANLAGSNLSVARLHRSSLNRADLRGANLANASLQGANLKEARLGMGSYDHEAFGWLRSIMSAHRDSANLVHANLSRANLEGADLSGTNLTGATLTEATLIGANLRGANLDKTDLSGADLSKADLSKALLVKTKFNKANLTNSRVYGISAWDLVLDNTTQTGLIITKPGDPEVTVGDIEVAQFIYFMLENKKIRRVINALTSKAVLILGRFTKKRKEILDAVRDKLSMMDYLPIIFDFDKPTDRDFTETVLTLACLSKFVIIDLTDPSSSPHESKTIIPDLEIPFLPIVQKGQREYAMFKNFKKYPWVLKGKTYKNKDDLIQNIEKLTEAAEAKYIEIRAQKDNSSLDFTPL